MIVTKSLTFKAIISLKQLFSNTYPAFDRFVIYEFSVLEFYFIFKKPFKMNLTHYIYFAKLLILTSINNIYNLQVIILNCLCATC